MSSEAVVKRKKFEVKNFQVCMRHRVACPASNSAGVAVFASGVAGGEDPLLLCLAT